MCLFALFQQSKNRFITQGYTSPVTLWNKLTIGELKKISKASLAGGFTDIRVKSLLQPGFDGDCVSLLILFGKVPSWYSMPCDRSLPPKTLICKRYTRRLRQAGDYIGKHHRKILCQGKELVLFDNCFGIKWGLYFSSHLYLDTDSYKQYVAELFSIITRHTLESYQLHIFGSLSQNDTIPVCLTTSRQVGLANDYTRDVNIWEYPCNPKTTIPTFTFVPSSKKQMAHCLPNQFQCSDGACVTQHHVCSIDTSCASSVCSCKTNGHTMNDLRYCHTACLPGECLCTPHHFQCISGGCIDMALVCDGRIHCRDASDEMCDSEFVALKFNGDVIEMTLGNRNFCLGFVCQFGQCLNLKYIDDLLPDCPGGHGEDEAKMLELRFKDHSFTCENPNDFPCVPGLSVCFPINKICLYDPDEDGHPKWCKDGVHLGECIGIKCTNSYKCPKSYCIPYHRVCDGNVDCIHGEDEEHCDEYICKGLLRCLDTKICVHPTQVCDGVNHCPNADDEALCGATLCPNGCSCLSYSIICTTETVNIFPVISSDYFKHIALAGSYIPYPDFNNICLQMNVLFMNLSGNHVRDICVPLKNVHNCKLHRKVIMFDLSYNDIMQLRTFCFKSLMRLKILILAYNPLHTIHDDAFSSSSISYISLRGTKLTFLSRAIISGLKTYVLDITQNSITSLDKVSRDIISNIPYLNFDDVRLCCIFPKTKQCDEPLKQAALCRTLLPGPTLRYITSSVGGALVIYNIIAFYAALRFRHFVHQYKFISFQIAIDATLAMYVPAIGAADFYYKSQFILSMNQWTQNILCRLMESLSAIATLLSICHSGLHIYLMNQVITRLTSNFRDVKHKLMIAKITITLLTVFFKIALPLFGVFTSESNRHHFFLCNIMGNSNVKTTTGLVWVITLCISMVASFTCIAISVLKVINHMATLTEGVEALIGRKNASSHHRSGVRNVLILFLITKTLTYLPYPLFLIWCCFSGTAPGDNSLYITLTFIILESFANPTMFVFRPLWVQWRRKRSASAN